MSAYDDEEASDGLHPRETQQLFGHAEAERILLEAYRGGRIPHAWLIGGPRGVGKATLAYRMARFVLAHPDPNSKEVQSARSLAVDPEHPVARRMAVQAQADLLVLERTVNERGKLRQDIAVDDVRRTVSFFGSTAGEGGWRIAIVDAVDELNDAGANALLKIVEEPPPRALLLLITHVPGLVMPTIRSRCRVLYLRPLGSGEVAQAVAAACGRDLDAEVLEAAGLAEGSVGRAVSMLQGPALALRQRLTQLLERLPETDPLALHSLGDAMAGADPQPLATFVDTVNAWLSARLAVPQETGRMARIAEAWEKVNRAASEVQEFNLERKPLVFSVFAVLAETARS
ncbi:MAG: polymerase subunit delta [Alphaproteobacteria bacterium]|nr:polymerase subunit delta [Alphaproteobacteria bacterium]